MIRVLRLLLGLACILPSLVAYFLRKITVNCVRSFATKGRYLLGHLDCDILIVTAGAVDVKRELLCVASCGLICIGAALLVLWCLTSVMQPDEVMHHHAQSICERRTVIVCQREGKEREELKADYM